MSFDTNLPTNYADLQKQLKKLNYERFNLQVQLRHTEPCECSCDGCATHCEGNDFERNYDSVDDLEGQLANIEDQMGAVKANMTRLEKYAKQRNIELETTAK